MEKTQLIDRYSDNAEQRVTLSHIYDLMIRSADRNILLSSDFISERDRGAVESLLSACGCTSYLFFGGHPEAERCSVVFLPDYLTAEDVTGEPSLSELAFVEAAVSRFDAPDADLSHRDVLGSLMGLGIERDAIGDILCEKAKTVIIVRAKLADFLLENLTKISRYKVDVKVYDRYEITPKIDYVEDSDTVASMRLDAVAASVFRLSRSGAVEAIDGGLVSVNGVTVTKSDRTVGEGDKISLRGKGKVVIDGIDGRSKKGRLRFRFRKYK